MLLLNRSDYWDAALEEGRIRGYLVEHEYRVTKEEFDLSLIADGLLSGRKIRSLQANYGISVCGEMFKINEREEMKKYRKL